MSHNRNKSNRKTNKRIKKKSGVKAITFPIQDNSYIEHSSYGGNFASFQGGSDISNPAIPYDSKSHPPNLDFLEIPPEEKFRAPRCLDELRGSPNDIMSAALHIGETIGYENLKDHEFRRNFDQDEVLHKRGMHNVKLDESGEYEVLLD